MSGELTQVGMGDGDGAGDKHDSRLCYNDAGCRCGGIHHANHPVADGWPAVMSRLTCAGLMGLLLVDGFKEAAMMGLDGRVYTGCVNAVERESGDGRHFNITMRLTGSGKVVKFCVRVAD